MVEEEEAGGVSVEESEEDEAEARRGRGSRSRVRGWMAHRPAPAPSTRPRRRPRRRELPQRLGRHARRRPSAPPFPIDESLRIKDPISAWFVGIAIAVFLLIFLSAMAFRRHGAFTPVERRRRWSHLRRA
jgi:hypothetical protein